MNTPIVPPFYPARPVNGGPLDKALPKSGEWTHDGKYNGWRAWVHNPTGLMFNRKLEPLSISHEFKPALTILHQLPWEWSDVEALERRHKIGQGSLILLDSPMEGIFDRRRMFLRAAAIDLGIPEHTNPALPLGNHQVYLPLWDDGDPLLFYQSLQAANRKLGCEFWEGVVAKRNDSLYPRQRRSAELEFPFWMKHRWAF